MIKDLKNMYFSLRLTASTSKSLLFLKPSGQDSTSHIPHQIPSLEKKSWGGEGYGESLFLQLSVKMRAAKIPMLTRKDAVEKG